MSLPSIFVLAQAKGIDIAKLSSEEKEVLLVDAIRKDMPEAVAYLHKLGHKAQETGEPVDWIESPNSVLGKQLIRIHASDAMRPLVAKHLCHGAELSFVNCCKGVVGNKDGKKKTLEELVNLQIATQSGDIAAPDC